MGLGRQFEAEFIRLFRDRFAGLFQYLARLTGDVDTASDLAQDAFIQLYQRGDLPNDLGPWLVTVAHNRWRDQQRSQQRRLRLLDAHPGSVPAPTAGDGADVMVEAAERRARVQAVLERLPEREKQLLLLHHSGYSYREIALILPIAETSVGTLLRRAGAAFRQAYEDSHGTPD